MTTFEARNGRLSTRNWNTTILYPPSTFSYPLVLILTV